MDPILQELEIKSNLINQLVKNKSIIKREVLTNYLDTFKLLSIDQKQKLYSLDNNFKRCLFEFT